MINNKDQAIVIPFYICDVAQPILSAKRLAEQGFEIVLSDQPTMKHPSGFESTLKPQNGLYYLTMKTTGTPINTRSDSKETEISCDATRDSDKQHTYLTNNVQFQWTNWKTTDEQ